MSDVSQNSVQRLVDRHFNYMRDRVQFDRPEDWRSHADEVERGDSFNGDCDDFAMTCAELLTRRGADKSEVGIAFCKTDTGVHHLVCMYKGWILDNRRHWAVAWDKAGYEWISVMYLADPGNWMAFAEDYK